jgi:hypothetical protein
MSCSSFISDPIREVKKKSIKKTKTPVAIYEISLPVYDRTPEREKMIEGKGKRNKKRWEAAAGGR